MTVIGYFGAQSHASVDGSVNVGTKDLLERLYLCLLPVMRILLHGVQSFFEGGMVISPLSEEFLMIILLLI